MKKSDKIKRKILNNLEEKREVIHIEITPSKYVKGKWNIRFGDIIGSTELINTTMEKILKEIEDEMGCLR